MHLVAIAVVSGVIIFAAVYGAIAVFLAAGTVQQPSAMDQEMWEMLREVEEELREERWPKT